MDNELSPEQRKEIENHRGTLKVLWNIYGGFKGLLKSRYFRYAVIFDFIILIATYYTRILSSYEVINYLTDKVLSILPNIIGFNIGAYALVIGFGHRDVIEKMAISKDNKYSLFQKMGGTFAFSVIVQSMTIVFAFLLDLFTSIFKFNLLNLVYLTEIINFIVLFIFLFATLYSIFLIPQIVLNVFGFSQLYHFYTRQSKIENEESDEDAL